jgi:hypothetical protein
MSNLYSICVHYTAHGSPSMPGKTWDSWRFSFGKNITLHNVQVDHDCKNHGAYPARTG